MGCSIAWRLAQEKQRVLVLERSVPGAEASSAAAGMLVPHAEAHGDNPMTRLMMKSAARFPKLSTELQNATGMDVEYRRSGALRVAFTARQGKELKRPSWASRAKVQQKSFSSAGLSKLESSLAKLHSGVLYPKDARIDPRLFLRSTHLAALRSGAEFRSGTYVECIEQRAKKAEAVRLEDGTRIMAGTVVVAAGSWSALVEGVPLQRQDVIPARGQVIELTSSSPLTDRVIFGPDCYAVPRDDGRILIGSTTEFVGHRRGVTARAARDLLTAAIALMPALGDARLTGSWSNFRPFAADGLPVLGKTGVDGLLLATGHYRTGILLAPITAEIIRCLILGKRSPVPLASFSSSRLARSSPLSK